jgi:hypothetical protein
MVTVIFMVGNGNGNGYGNGFHVMVIDCMSRGNS